MTFLGLSLCRNLFN